MPGSRWLAAILRSLSDVIPWRYLPGSAAALAVVLLVALGVVEEREYWSLERWFFEIGRARKPAAPVVIVVIEAHSCFELDKQWPFPRYRPGELVQRIAA